MNRRGEKRVGAGRETSASFTKITKEMNQLHLRENNCYIYLENRWERFHTFGKSRFLDHETSTMIQTSCNFLPLLMCEFGSIRRCLAFPGKIHR